LSGGVYSLAASADGKKLMAMSSVVSGNIAGYGSTNGGNSWLSNNLPVANSWIAVASSADGTKLVAVSQKTGIYSSTDSGQTWISNNAPPLIWQAVASSADGTKLFAVVHNGGIWTLQITPTPLMHILSTNHLILSWIIPSTNFVLQSSTNLGNWMDLTNEPVINLTNLQDQVVLPRPGSNVFFRLKTP
jgi:hypothetical protein